MEKARQERATAQKPHEHRNNAQAAKSCAAANPVSARLSCVEDLLRGASLHS